MRGNGGRREEGLQLGGLGVLVREVAGGGADGARERLEIDDRAADVGVAL